MKLCCQNKELNTARNSNHRNNVKSSAGLHYSKSSKSNFNTNGSKNIKNQAQKTQAVKTNFDTVKNSRQNSLTNRIQQRKVNQTAKSKKNNGMKTERTGVSAL